jgi:hypothetical protein
VIVLVLAIEQVNRLGLCWPSTNAENSFDNSIKSRQNFCFYRFKLATLQAVLIDCLPFSVGLWRFALCPLSLALAFKTETVKTFFSFTFSTQTDFAFNRYGIAFSELGKFITFGDVA